MSNEMDREAQRDGWRSRQTGDRSGDRKRKGTNERGTGTTFRNREREIEKQRNNQKRSNEVDSQKDRERKGYREKSRPRNRKS